MRVNIRSVILAIVCFAAAGPLQTLRADQKTKPGTTDPAAPDAAVTYQITTSHNAVISTPGLKPPLTVVWSLELSGTASYPLIVGHTVYVIGGSTLYALNAATGATLWSQTAPSGYGGWIGAAYENGLVFVVDGAPNLNGAMFAFNATTGAQVWEASLPNQYVWCSPPAALNGIVYTGGAGDGGTVYAVQETDGTLLWTGEVENGMASSPAINDGGVFVSYVCPQSYRFNAETGSQVWHYSGECEGGGGDTAVVFNNNVYVRMNFVGSNGLILTEADGTTNGEFSSTYAPVFSGSTAFYTESNSISAVDLATGATLWTAAPATGDSFSTSPILVNNVIYVGTQEGNLEGYAARSGDHGVSMNLGYAISGGEGGAPQAGLGAAQGLLVVPASTHVFALKGTP